MAQFRLPANSRIKPGKVFKAAAGALDHRRPNLLLEQADLLRHRRLGHEKLVGRPGERKPPRYRLEGAQCVERG